MSVTSVWKPRTCCAWKNVTSSWGRNRSNAPTCWMLAWGFCGTVRRPMQKPSAPWPCAGKRLHAIHDRFVARLDRAALSKPNRIKAYFSGTLYPYNETYSSLRISLIRFCRKGGDIMLHRYCSQFIAPCQLADFSARSIQALTLRLN